MTPREIIRAVLTFDNPPRIGLRLPAPFGQDFISGHWSGGQSRALEPRRGEKWRRMDEWGVTWASLTNIDKGEPVEPAVADWKDLDAYQPPDMGRAEDYVKAAAKWQADGNQHYRTGSLPGFTFNVARYIRKLEYYLCDLAGEPENIARLHAIVRAELLKAIDRYAEIGADAILFCEDWGTQDRLMVSPAMWRAIFKPEFAALAGRAHEHGMFVLMHSCGRMTAVIEDMIECGINCFLFDQPRLHGIEALADAFGGRASFCCPVDIQTTLQTKDPVRIREDVRLMIDHLGGKSRGWRGGFIADYYGGNEAIGLTEDVQEIACRAFAEYAGY
ncbi:MAG: uroporphyrinogen decarboxylase family protein [Phycisphaerae bacterium]|nr:uroporphyrinogen decarboxylase family protein [Phycisphaerae bacterium]